MHASLTLLLLSTLTASATPAAGPAWKALQAGVDYAVIRYETGFNENDDEKAQWPIPNLLAVPRQ